MSVVVLAGPEEPPRAHPGCDGGLPAEVPRERRPRPSRVAGAPDLRRRESFQLLVSVPGDLGQLLAAPPFYSFPPADCVLVVLLKRFGTWVKGSSVKTGFTDLLKNVF